MHFFQLSNSQTTIISFLVIIILYFSSISRGYAEIECSPWLEIPQLNLNCWFKTNNPKWRKKSLRTNIGQKVELHFLKIFNSMVQELVETANFSVTLQDIEEEQFDKETTQVMQELLKSIDWLTYIQPMQNKLMEDFQIFMEPLFDQKIRLLLVDIDQVLKSIDWSDSLETILENRLFKLDQVLLNAFQRYNNVTSYTSQQIKTDILTHVLKQITQIQHKTAKSMKLNISEIIGPFQMNMANTLNQIKTQLPIQSFKQLDNLRQEFRQEISYFLDKSEYFAKRINCTIETSLASLNQNRFQSIPKEVATKIAPFSLDVTMTGQPLPIATATGNVSIESQKNVEQDETETPFKSVVEPLFCYQKLGLQTPPEPWEYSTLYDLKKCHLLHTLTPGTPLKRILNVYLDLKAWAAKIACIQHGAGHHATQHYIWDWLEFGYLYNLWYTHY
jgi:hypothetical protein